MTQAAKAQEPSMEEILASIRRIIADDDPKAGAQAAPPPPPPKPAAPPPPPVTAAPPPPAPPAPPPPVPPKPDPAQMLRQAATLQSDIDLMLKDTPPVPPKPPEPKEDVLDLTESMVAPAPPPPAAENFQTIHGEPDVVFSEADPEPPPPPPKFVPDPPQTVPERPLLSATTSRAVDSAFNTLAHTVLVQNARTLEDLVREMLRPLLKNWLDDTLQGIVERLVKAEIDRVSRGRS